jgi:hypothetical protein
VVHSGTGEAPAPPVTASVRPADLRDPEPMVSREYIATLALSNSSNGAETGLFTVSTAAVARNRA